MEKMLTHLGVGMSGAQYIHYAFGLLDRTNVFSPVQAVLDDSAVGMVRNVARKPKFDADDVSKAVNEVGKVMKSGTRLFARHIRKHLRRGVVSDPFPYAGEGSQDETIARAAGRLAEIRSTPGEPLPEETIAKIREAVPGLLSIDNFRL
jgi:trimethylamine--corrinoid protein Co-methyltransferase